MKSHTPPGKGMTTPICVRLDLTLPLDQAEHIQKEAYGARLAHLPENLEDLTSLNGLHYIYHMKIAGFPLKGAFLDFLSAGYPVKERLGCIYCKGAPTNLAHALAILIFEQ